jgi:hypothetical protein
LSNAQVCSRPSTQKFKCTFKGGLTGANSNGGSGGIDGGSDITAVSQEVSSSSGNNFTTMSEGFTVGDNLNLSESGLALITIDGGKTPLSDPALISPNYVSGITTSSSVGMAIPVGNISNAYIVKAGPNASYNFSAGTNNTVNNNSPEVYSYTINSPRSKKLEEDSVNLNTKSGGSAHTYTLPSSGVFIITIDGYSFGEPAQLFSFYVIGSLVDSNVKTTLLPILNCNTSIIQLTGMTNGKFSVSVTDGITPKKTNYTAFYNQLYGTGTQTNTQLPFQEGSFNCNNLNNGSAKVLSLPASGLFFVTIDGGKGNDLTKITSFFVSAVKSSNTPSVIQKIYPVENTQFKLTPLGNAQFSVSYEKDTDKKTSNFNAYYTFIYGSSS